jgi:hypothetical protein
VLISFRLVFYSYLLDKTYLVHHFVSVVSASIMISNQVTVPKSQVELPCSSIVRIASSYGPSLAVAALVNAGEGIWK